MTSTPSAQDIKSCCTAAYGSDVVALLLGESYHPGGLALTRHLAGQLHLHPAARVLDVAAGRGATAMLLAQEYAVQVDGVDLSDANMALARGAAAAAGLPEVDFTVGDAERLPHADATFDAVICECAFCTFPDKPTAAAELARVLKPGGRLGLTDVIADTVRLPSELTSLTAWVSCVADARPLDEHTALLTGLGLSVIRTERHDDVMTRMIDQIEARLSLVRMTARQRAELAGIDFDKAPAVLATARAAVNDGLIGYGLLVAEKPPAGQPA